MFVLKKKRMFHIFFLIWGSGEDLVNEVIVFTFRKYIGILTPNIPPKQPFSRKINILWEFIVPWKKPHDSRSTCMQILYVEERKQMKWIAKLIYTAELLEYLMDLIYHACMYFWIIKLYVYSISFNQSLTILLHKLIEMALT